MRHPGSYVKAFVLIVALSAGAFAGLVVQDDATGQIYCRSQRFLIPYEAADSGPSGVSAVRLYYTSDNGNTWTLFGEKPDTAGSFEFIAPADGVYGFTVEAIDKAGNVELKNGPAGGTKPEISVVIDTRAPQVEPVFPRQDLELAPGAHLRVRFRAADPNLSPSTAAISVQKDDMDSWVALPNVTFQDNEFFAQGEVLFPGTYNVMLSVGDRAGNSAQSTFSFVCTHNAKPPSNQTGPIGRDWEVPLAAPPRAKSLVFDIDYRVDDIGGMPPSAVGLWYTTDSGVTWQFYGRDPDVASPFRFQAPSEGIYGFKLTATSQSGISEAPPKPGSKPDIQTLVDVTFPTLMLDDPRGGESYPGGEVHYLTWTARDDHFGSLPISLYLSRDGGQWELLAADLPNNGVYGWNVPYLEYAACRLKIEARDQVGNTTSVTSDTFYIVSAPAETRILSVVAAVPQLGVSEYRPEPVEKVQETPQPQPTPPPTQSDDVEMKKLVQTATGLRLRGDYEAAEAALRQAMQKSPHSTLPRCELGAVLIQEGRHSDAVDVLREARALDATDLDVLYNLATAYYALSDYTSAAAAFETFVAIDPRNEAALWNLVNAYQSAGNTAMASQAARKIVALDVPGSPFTGRARRYLEAVRQPDRP